MSIKKLKLIRVDFSYSISTKRLLKYDRFYDFTDKQQMMEYLFFSLNKLQKGN